MAKKPDFKHPSWDTTVWSLWGLLYTGAESDTALRTAISQKYGDTRAQLKQLGAQVGPMKKKKEEWTAELKSYARTITYGEADEVLQRLTELHRLISEQVTRERQQVKSNKKPASPATKKAQAAHVPVVALPDSDQEEDEDEEGLEWALKNQSSIMGHSVATAKAPPARVARPYVPPTPEQLWRDEQRRMAAECDNGIGFGAHDVAQDAVVRRLHLAPGDGGVRQYRATAANSHVRIMVSRNGVQFWTLGLSHRERRDAGHYSVYRREGTRSEFVFVGGERHPRDPGP